MKKRTYILRFEKPISNKYLENFLRVIIDISSKFCSVEYIVQEKSQLKNRDIRNRNGLDSWL